jgi:hypothetical protein
MPFGERFSCYTTPVKHSLTIEKGQDMGTWESRARKQGETKEAEFLCCEQTKELIQNVRILNIKACIRLIGQAARFQRTVRRSNWGKRISMDNG